MGNAPICQPASSLTAVSICSCPTGRRSIAVYLRLKLLYVRSGLQISMTCKPRPLCRHIALGSIASIEKSASK